MIYTPAIAFTFEVLFQLTFEKKDKCYFKTKHFLRQPAIRGGYPMPGAALHQCVEMQFLRVRFARQLGSDHPECLASLDCEESGISRGVSEAVGVLGQHQQKCCTNCEDEGGEFGRITGVATAASRCRS